MVVEINAKRQRVIQCQKEARKLRQKIKIFSWHQEEKAWLRKLSVCLFVCSVTEA